MGDRRPELGAFTSPLADYPLPTAGSSGDVLRQWGLHMVLELQRHEREIENAETERKALEARMANIEKRVALISTGIVVGWTLITQVLPKLLPLIIKLPIVAK